MSYIKDRVIHARLMGREFGPVEAPTMNEVSAQAQLEYLSWRADHADPAERRAARIAARIVCKRWGIAVPQWVELDAARSRRARIARVRLMRKGA